MLFLGTNSWNDKDLLKFLEKNPKLNVAFCAEQTQDSTSELSDMFLSAYRTEYGEDSQPTAKMAVAFDAYVMAVKAIESSYNTLLESNVEDLAAQAKSDGEALSIRNAYQKSLEEGIPSGTNIKDALNAITDFKGASGVINYSGNNEPTKSISINHIQAGEDMPAYVVK